jgi:antitoxin YefM
VLSREKGKDVVIMSLADFNSIQETLHLLGSPKNAARLMESIAQLREGKARPREL